MKKPALRQIVITSYSIHYTKLYDNLFLTLANGEQRQITSDGGNGIVNGKSVHRNEFGITGGIFPSPEGNYVAFYRKDETMVKDYPLVDFMTRERNNFV